MIAARHAGNIFKMNNVECDEVGMLGSQFNEVMTLKDHTDARRNENLFS